MIFWHKIVIFHTKYPKKFRASLRSAQCHFQQYFSYIVAVSFIGGGTGVPGENQRPAASQ
jgi:hypothetical protein